MTPTPGCMRAQGLGTCAAARCPAAEPPSADVRPHARVRLSNVQPASLVSLNSAAGTARGPPDRTQSVPRG